MKALDRWLQNARIDIGARYVPDGAVVLDIGAADGVLFRRLGNRIAGGVGIDPDAPAETRGSVRLITGVFPAGLDSGECFDAITAFATFEHVSDHERDDFVRACFDRLQPGGRCILTVPSPMVDKILHVLIALRVLDGMHEAEHHGFDVSQTPVCFEQAGFTLHAHRRFQFGLNNLFVFERPAAS